MIRIAKLLLFVFLIISMTNLQAQKKERAYLKLYYQNIDNEIQLRAELKTKIDSKFYPLVGAELVFSTIVDENENELLTLVTDKKGEALYKSTDSINKLKSADGKVYFNVAYSGCDTLKSASADVEIIPLLLNSELKINDSIATVHVSALVLNNSTSNLEGAKVGIFVKRLFGLEKLGEAELDTNGNAEFEFSLPIIAATKNVTMVTAIDNDDFGTIKATNVIESVMKPDNDNPAQKPNHRLPYIGFMVMSLMVSWLLAYLLNKFIY